MNLGYTTTGIKPLTIGSTELFQLAGDLDGQTWDLTGGSANLTIRDPNGIQSSFTATIVGGGAQVTWTVVGPATIDSSGNRLLDSMGRQLQAWRRSWTLVDSQGRTQVSLPIAFEVLASP